MTNMPDLKKKSDQELIELTQAGRETVRAERFKDKFSKSAHVIHSNKKDVARALTELHARRNKSVTN